MSLRDRTVDPGPRSIPGVRIAELREARGWTYQNLARRMGDSGCKIDASAIHRIEKGKPRRRITVDELYGFALAFDMPIGQLVTSPALTAQQELTACLQAAQDARRRFVPIREEYRAAVAALGIALVGSHLRENYARMAAELRTEAMKRPTAEIHDQAEFWADVETAIDNFQPKERDDS